MNLLPHHLNLVKQWKSPAPLLPKAQFKLLDQVDWWEDVISKDMDGEEYIVYFAKSQEDLVFSKSKLRLHQDWIDGMWIIASISKGMSCCCFYIQMDGYITM